MTKNKSQKNIPDGWKIMKLGEVSNIFDGTHQTPDYKENGVPFYSVEHLTANDFTDTKYVSEEVFEQESKRVKIEKGDILMTRIGDVGTARYISWEARASFYVSLALIKCNKLVNSKFLTFFINSAHFQREIWGKTIHVAFPNKINLGDISKCASILPPLSEQKRIVAVLEIWDEMVEKLARKIEIKKNIKKGLMQELLSGKKRLSGFTNEWVIAKLGDICKRESSNIAANLLENNEGEYRIYGASGLLKKINFYQQDEFYVSIVKDGAGVGRLFLCEPKTSTLGTLDNLKVKENNNLLFLYSLLQKIEFRKYIVGSTIPHIYFKDYKIEKINIPKDIKEQKAIADILVTADREIEKLEEKLRIIKEQKKFLLNNLITGQIRVPADNE